MSPVPSAEPVATGDGTRPPGGLTGGGSSRYFEEDIASLDFPARVLALADDAEGGPLLERVRLVAGAAQAVDEILPVPSGSVSSACWTARRGSSASWSWRWPTRESSSAAGIG
jgi:hypothetical protein